MYITGLEASGLKGLSFAHELQRCVLFTGSNFVGKSARLEAIRFALQARVPDLKKTNQALWGLSGASEVRARVVFDSAVWASTRMWKEAETVKIEHIGPADADFENMPMLDPEQYFGLTDSERIQYVFGMMKMPETFTIDGIIADLRNLSLEENTEQTEKARNAVIGTCENVLRAEEYQPLSKALTELTQDKGTLKTSFSYWNRRAKDTQGTLRVLSELKTRAGDCTADTIQGIASDLARVASELETANQRAGALSRQQMEANRVGLRRKQIDAELVTPAPGQEDPKPHVAAIAAIDKKLKKSKAPDADELERLEDAFIAARDSLNAAGADQTTIQGTVDTAAENLEKLEKQVVCPHCKSKGKDWKKNLRAEYANVLAEHQTQLSTIEKQIKALIGKHGTALDAFNKAKTAYEARQELLTERQRHQTTLDSINAGTAVATARRQALQEELERLGESKAPTEAELNESAATAMRLRQEHTALTERHTRLVALQQDLIRAGEAAEEHQLAAAKVAVIKAVGVLLKERQASMIAVLFGDLMKVANYFTRDIMEHELIFQDGRIGYVKQGRLVSHETFSGTERALTYIAITAALMRDAPLRLVLLDEFDIDADVFPKVLNRLNGAVTEGLIDQVIVAHTDIPRDKLIAGDWQHIPLSKAA